MSIHAEFQSRLLYGAFSMTLATLPNSCIRIRSQETDKDEHQELHRLHTLAVSRLQLHTSHSCRLYVGLVGLRNKLPASLTAIRSLLFFLSSLLCICTILSCVVCLRSPLWKSTYMPVDDAQCHPSDKLIPLHHLYSPRHHHNVSCGCSVDVTKCIYSYRHETVTCASQRYALR